MLGDKSTVQSYRTISLKILSKSALDMNTAYALIGCLELQLENV